MKREFTVNSSKHEELIDITDIIQKAVRESGIKDGRVFIYVPHTTCAVTINENADPSVRHDIIVGLDHAVPYLSGFRHSEGNSPAHIKSSIIGCSCEILVEGGSLLLGTWQGIFLCEFDGPRRRRVIVKVLPD